MLLRRQAESASTAQEHTHNVYLLDGTELNDRGCGGCYMVLPSQDSIAEFQTLDSNYSPDYGIGSGGTITMVIKSGDEEFPRRVVRIQPQHGLQRQRLFQQAGGQNQAGIHAE